MSKMYKMEETIAGISATIKYIDDERKALHDAEARFNRGQEDDPHTIIDFYDGQCTGYEDICKEVANRLDFILQVLVE